MRVIVEEGLRIAGRYTLVEKLGRDLLAGKRSLGGAAA